MGHPAKAPQTLPIVLYCFMLGLPIVILKKALYAWRNELKAKRLSSDVVPIAKLAK